MGTLKIGRVGLDVTLDTPSTWDSSSGVAGRTDTVTGWLAAASLAQTQALRTELLEQASLNIPVAVTWSDDATMDGFFYLRSVNIDARARYLSISGTGRFPFTLTLERIGASGQTEFQSLITAALVANDHGLDTSETAAFHAPPVGHVAYRTNASSFPTARTRTTADSATALDWYDDIDVTGDPSWSIEPANYYLGAAKIYVSGRLRSGLDVPNDVDDFEISNGLVKVTPGTTTGTSNGRLTVQMYNGSSWDTGLSYSIWYNATTEIPAWHYLSVLSNEPHEVRLRLVRDANDTEGSRAHTLDISLRRGSRFAEFYYSWNGSNQNIQFGRTTTDAGAAISVTGQTSSPGLVDSVATESNKYVMVSPHTQTQDTTNGKITRSASTTCAFAIGAEVGASPGTGNTSDALAKQYLKHVSENVRAVRR